MAKNAWQKGGLKVLRFDVITLFPEMFPPVVETSILGRAVRAKKLKVVTHNLRDFGAGPYRQVDDRPFGGGAGMLLQPQPLFAAVKKARGRSPKPLPVVHFSPRGADFTQKVAAELAATYDRLILVCGHYEGIDQRFVDECVTHEFCVGQAVLTGGELPALFCIDAVARLRPGVLGHAASAAEESFSAELDGKREYPHYTRPAVWRGRAVPDVLLSGNHAAIARWRRENLR